MLLARTFTSPFKLQARHGGLGVDAGLFDRQVARLSELGYATARTQLVWPLGRMLLHRGDPNLTALGVEDLDELRAAIDAFTARLRLGPGAGVLLPRAGWATTGGGVRRVLAVGDRSLARR